MQNSQITIRPAGPLDVEALIPLVHSSGYSEFDFVFVDRKEQKTADFLRFSLQDEQGEHGWGHHVVAVHDDQVVGAGACYDGTQARGHTLDALRKIFGHYGLWRGPGVIRRGLQIERVVRPPRGDLHYIGHLGVTKDWRGRGVGTQLVEFLLNEGRARKSPRAALDVSIENPQAQALYERLGFEVTGETEANLKSAFGRVVAHRRMEIELCARDHI